MHEFLGIPAEVVLDRFQDIFDLPCFTDGCSGKIFKIQKIDNQGAVAKTVSEN